MKKLLKRIFSLLASLAVIAVLGVLIVLNTTWVSQWAADTYGSQYGFGYGSIRGGLITGLEVKEVRFKDETLLDRFETGINPLSLIYGKVSITHMAAEGIDLNVVRKVAETFTPVQEKELEERDGFQFPVTVSAENIDVSFEPFEMYRIGFEKVSLGIDKLNYREEGLDVKGLMLEADTNVTRISLQAKMHDRKAVIDSLFLKEIDIKSIMTLATTLDQNRTDHGSNGGLVARDAPQAVENPLIPKMLVVKNLFASSTESVFEPLHLNSATITLKDLRVDIGSMQAKSGTFMLESASNFALLKHDGKIEEGRLESRGRMTLLQALYDTYQLPVKEKGLGDIIVDIDADREKVIIGMDIRGEKFLEAERDEFNIDHLTVENHITYLPSEKKLTVRSNGEATTTFTDKTTFDGFLNKQEENLSYGGIFQLGEIRGIDANLTGVVRDLTLTGHGDAKRAEILIDAANIEGRGVTEDFHKADFVLGLKSPLILKEMVLLPDQLDEAQIDRVHLRMPLDFSRLIPLEANVTVRSNLADIDAQVSYDKVPGVRAELTIPKGSLLHDLDENLHPEALSPLHVDLSMSENQLVAKCTSDVLGMRSFFDPATYDVDGNMTIGSARFRFKGNRDGNMTLQNHTVSLKTLFQQIQPLYTFESPPLDGDLDLNMRIGRMEEVALDMHSRRLIQDGEGDAPRIFTDTMASLGYSDSVLTLKRYRTTFQDQKLFATKPSVVTLKENNITISPLWINDALKVSGYFDAEGQKGKLMAYAEPLEISHKVVDTAVDLNLSAQRDQNRTELFGEVVIHGGEIHLDLEQKHYAADKDIIIVQQMKKKNENDLMNELEVMVSVHTKEPLVYQSKDADIKATTDIMLQKTVESPLNVLGTAELERDSSYTIEGKKFVIKKGIVAFTGDPNNPILDIEAVYNSINYEITVQITGSPETPSIYFSSIPRLTRGQIISVILFDSVEAAESNSGNEMMMMVGGLMAKSVLNNVGIKIDHLTIGSEGNMEVGKRVAEKTTIIYVNDDVSGVKLQYDYSHDIKAILSTDAESSGAGIIYKKEFKDWGSLLKSQSLQR